jgi:hypothetical protein
MTKSAYWNREWRSRETLSITACVVRAVPRSQTCCVRITRPGCIRFLKSFASLVSVAVAGSINFKCSATSTSS